MSRQAVMIIAVFALALSGMAFSSQMVSAQTGVSPKANSSSSAFSCAENWSCSSWSGCSDEGASTRTCTDRNNCGTQVNKSSESQGCATATGIVRLSILQPPKICGDGKCSKNETCDSCPKDCGICSVAFDLTGLITGNIKFGSYGSVLIFVIAVVLVALFFNARKKNRRNNSGQYFINTAP